MVLHGLTFRAFCQATEDEFKVVQALKFVSGVDDVSRSRSEGYFGNLILILEARVSSSRKIDAIFRRLDKSSIEEMIDSLESRVDDECSFFFRLDKQEAYLGRLVMREGQEVIAVRGKIESYPKRRDAALANMERYLESLVTV